MWISRRHTALLALLVTLGACATNRDANQAGLPAPLYGMVYDGGNQPVLGARVSVAGSPGEVTTDINGRFVLGSLEAGSYQIVVTAQGHETLSLAVDFVDPKQVLYVKLLSLEDLLDAVALDLEARRTAAARRSLERARAIDPGNVVGLYLEALTAYLAADAGGATARLNEIRSLGFPYPAVEILAADVAEYLSEDPAAAAAALRRALAIRWDPTLEARAAELEAREAQAPP